MTLVINTGDPAPDPNYPVQLYPPALIFGCAVADCEWRWFARSAHAYERRLDRAWRQHRADHTREALELFG